MSLFRILIICHLVSSSGSTYAAGSVTPLSDDVIERLFAALPGTWNGRAIETPVGPVDYAINFHPCDEGVIAGVTELGVSVHSWLFRRSDTELRLTFLSTFRGNQEPTQLLVSKTEDNTIWLYAPELALLTLSLTLAERNVDIRVYHHQKPHVHIRLTRADRQITEAERAESTERTCNRF